MLWMRAVSRLVVPILLASFFAPFAVAWAQSGSEAEIRAVISSFFASYEKKDLDGLMRLWSDKSPDRAEAKQNLQDTFSRFDKIPVKGWVLQECAVNGDSATLRVNLKLENVDITLGKPFEGRGSLLRTFCLTRESGSWKLSRYLSTEEYLAGKIGDAKSAEERRTLIEANKSLVDSELGRALFNEGNRLGRQSKYSEALDVFLVLKDVALKINNKVWLAGAIHGIGGVQYERGRFTEAIASFEESLKLAEEAKDRQGVAFAYLSLGILSSEMGNYTAAVDLDNKSLDIYTEIGDRSDMGAVLNNIGANYHYLGDYNAALESYQKCIDVWTEQGLGIGTPLQNIGLIYIHKGDYVQAQQYLQKALDLQEAGKDPFATIGTLSNMGMNQYEQGNKARALDYFQRCLRMSEELNDARKMVQAMVNIGEVYNARGEYARALEIYGRGLAAARKMGDQASIAWALGSIGSTELDQGESSKALEHYRESLAITETIGDKPGTASTLIRQARAYLSQGKFEAVIESAGRALSIAGQIEAPEMLVSALTIQGKAYRKIGNPAKAKDAYARAIAAVEQLRSRVAGGREDRQKFLESKIVPYYEMADLLVGEGASFDALTLAERSKARGLLEVLQTGRSNVTKAMTAGELESERKLNSQLVSLNSQVMKERLRDKPDQNRLADLSVRLSKARSNYDTFRSNLYVTHPALEAQRGEFKPISLAECGSLINDRGTALLEFLVSDERVDLFVLTRKGTALGVPDLKTYSISIKKEALGQAVEKFREHLAKRDMDYSAEAANLYDLLLKPAANELAGKSNLVIVPDGVLWELPFQVMQPSRAHFLVQDYSVSYAPSLTALREMSKPRSKTVSTASKLSLLAFGNSVVRKERSVQIKEVFMDADLQPLPEAEDQVKTIGRIYGAGRSEVYVGDDATEDRLKARAGSCRILHIATHGIIDNANPMYSQIVLSQAQGSSDDGLLEAWEIANLDINADLVVLSACDTARGRVESGEGIIGLSWAFFIAGCPSTVVSQWSVEADSTSDLMVEFHRNLLAGLGKAEALRQAELKLLKSAGHSHPFYWAGFAVVGNGR